MIAARDRVRFETYAAPEAIKAQLDQVRARMYRCHRDLEWLEGLYVRRVAEKAAGAWPAEKERA